MRAHTEQAQRARLRMLPNTGILSGRKPKTL